MRNGYIIGAATVALLVVAGLSVASCAGKSKPLPVPPPKSLQERIETESTVVKVCGQNTYIVKLDNQLYVQKIEHGFLVSGDAIGRVEPGTDPNTICEVKPK